MKTSSADREASQLAVSPDAQVRPAVFDRPLGSTLPGALWGDPEIQRLVDGAVERGRAQGRAQGFAEGWAQGRQAAAEREQADLRARADEEAMRRQAASTRIEAAIGSLARAARALDQATAPAWTELADVITDGALAIARAALGRELEGLDLPVVEAIRTALRSLGEPDQVVMRLNPGDLALIQSITSEPLPDGLRFIADDDVEAGDVLALTPVQRLHVCLPGAIAAAEEVLRG